MNNLQSFSSFHALIDPTIAMNDDEATGSLDHVEYRSRNFGPVDSGTPVRIGDGHHHILFTGGSFKGGTHACEEIIGATDVFHDGTRYQRRAARWDVAVTSGSARVTWDRCPGLRSIIAGDYSSADRVRTGRPVNHCEVSRAPFEELTIVFCLNSEPFKGDVLNVRIPWRWLHFRMVGLYFWIRRTFSKE